MFADAELLNQPEKIEINFTRLLLRKKNNFSRKTYPCLISQRYATQWECVMVPVQYLIKENKQIFGENIQT